MRDFTVKALADLGYTSTDSQTNFIFTDIGKTMTAAAFRDGCAAKGVMVGRDFPPLEKTVGAHLARHDGRDAEGHRSIPQRAQAVDDDLVGEGAVGGTMALITTSIRPDRRHRRGRGAHQQRLGPRP